MTSSLVRAPLLLLTATLFGCTPSGSPPDGAPVEDSPVATEVAIPEAVTRRADPRALAALGRAPRVEFLAIDPEPGSGRGSDGPMIDAWAVLGGAPLDARGTREAKEALVAAFVDVTPPASCFDPRHALRFSEGAHEYVFLVCFECAGAKIHVDGEEVEAGRFGNVGAARLNALLDAHGIPRDRG